MSEIQERILKSLFALQDKKYRDFQSKLMPTVPAERVIGVRTPALRRLAKEVSPERDAFLSNLPHRYFEENQLHAFLISDEKDYRLALCLVDSFLPYVDNWATCDQLLPRSFRTRRQELVPEIRRWLDAAHPYTVRFGVGMLMRHYLDETFDPCYLEWVASVRSEEYYVNMMIAWYFATALAKQYDTAIPYLEKKRLPAWTHHKTIQKALESDRVPQDKKAYLRSLRQKRGKKSRPLCE